MLVVSNTSPVSNLAIIGRLDLLRERYGRVLIPPAVKTELGALTHPGGKNRIKRASRDGWLRVEPLPSMATTLVLPGTLDPGEIEAIQLCHHLSASGVDFIEDRVGEFFSNVVVDFCALDEFGTFFCHFLDVFFTHGAAKKVGTTESINPPFPRPPVFAKASTGRPVRPPALSTAFTGKAIS